MFLSFLFIFKICVVNLEVVDVWIVILSLRFRWMVIGREIRVFRVVVCLGVCWFRVSEIRVCVFKGLSFC